MAKHFKTTPEFSEAIETPSTVEPVSLLESSRESVHGKPKKKLTVGRVISNLLIIAGIAMLGVAAFLWGRQQLAYYKQEKTNEELAAYVTLDEEGSKPPVVDWEALKAINPDVCGWIQIPGTVVNYPVYQGEDNDRYLRHSATGEYAVGGQVFLDYENTGPGMIDPQSIIYGHHLMNGAMFKQVADMENQDFFNSIKTVWYVTQDANYELEPLLTYYTDPYDENVRRFTFKDTTEFREYLGKLLEKAVAASSDADKVVGVSTHVLTLSTCNYIDDFGRTLVVCVPKAEAQNARG